MDDKWQYHQNGRDEAVGKGCVTILAIVAIFAILLLVLTFAELP